MFGVHQTQFWNYNLVSQQRRENLQFTITIFQQKITFNVFSLVPARFPCHSKMKSHVLSVLSLSRITNTSKGNCNGFPGVKPTPHQLSTGFICLWRVATTMCPRKSRDLTCGPAQTACPGLVGRVSAPCCHLGTLGNSILVWYHLSSTCFCSRGRGLESGVTAREQHTPFPFTPHWPVLTSQSSSQPATKARRIGEHMDYSLNTKHLWEEYHVNVQSIPDSLYCLILSLKQLCNVKIPHSLLEKQAQKS